MIDNLLVGCSGSIGALNLPNYLIELKKIYKNIKVIMTSSSLGFVNEFTIETILQDKLYTDERQKSDFRPLHIELAQWAELTLVLPASANTISKAAHGMADNLLTSTLLCINGPLMFVPNMNELMWNNPFVKNNVSKLESEGRMVVHPFKQNVFIASKSETIEALSMPSPKQLTEILNQLFISRF